MAMAWRISSYGTWCCALSFIVLLAGCDEGLDVLDAFLVQFATRRGNHGGLDGPAMLGRSVNPESWRHQKEILHIFVTCA
jgi:hypothetical protein